jgi:4-hydroxy-tetrahydrodipicolinate reductase
MPNIRVAHVGLGPIGAAIAALVARRQGLTIVAAVDVDPQKAGRDLGDVIGLGRRLRVRVQADLAKTLKTAKPHVVVHCTGSSLGVVLPQLETIIGAKASIVSTTEELSYPFASHLRAAKRIDAVARKARVAVLGTGVNPGFTMDALPIMLTAVCERVERISVHRVQDARIRRLPFQQKIGAGLTVEEFARRKADGSVRHVGLTESIAMISDAVGMRVDRITDELQPKLAAADVASDFLKVPAGRVCGIVQDGTGYRNGEPLVRLHLEAYLGAPETYDAVDIDGVPKLSMRVPGGVHGDVATAAIVVNSIPKVLNAAPGLRTMRDLALPSYFSGRPDRSQR